MPQLLSLTRAGMLNASRVRAAAEAIVADDGTGAMQAFLELARDAAFSTNVDASKIDAFDAHDAVLSARAFQVHRAGGDDDVRLRAFEADQGTWLIRRTAFEALWRNGSQLVYEP